MTCEIGQTPWHRPPNKSVHRCTVYAHIQGELIYRHVEIDDRDIMHRDGRFNLVHYQHLIDAAKSELEHDYKIARLTR